MAKRAARSTQETKMHLAANLGYATMKHDQIGYNQLLSGITQGITDSSRIGDEIFLKKMYIKFVHESNATTSKPTTFRVLVLRTKKDTAPTDPQIFQGGTAMYINRFVNREYCSVLLDRTFYSVNHAANTHPTTYTHNLRVNLNRAHKFDGNNSTTGKYFNYWLIVVGHVSGGTQNSTDAGYYGFDVMTTYKDA